MPEKRDTLMVFIVIVGTLEIIAVIVAMINQGMIYRLPVLALTLILVILLTIVRKTQANEAAPSKRTDKDNKKRED